MAQSCFRLVYVTCASEDEAVSILRFVLEHRLAACGNIIPAIKSMFWWQGKIDSAEEVLLLLKTNQALEPQLTQAIGQLHSYECPCVVSLPILEGNPDFLTWLGEELKQSPES
ncbi:MAG: divalent-cation tolerance protein CutA [Lentisphaerae bacterium]|nr:MAG: divalent-cation tolerance protein CutA [Lentisphaerota bacterium]